MHLGLGLYRHQLNADHYRFARQCGCTHLVIHLVDYFRSSRSNKPGDQPVGDDSGWGLAGDPDKLWTYEELAAIKRDINAAGLELEAIENFDPAHWHDVLLDGPKKREQLENLKTIIRNVGRAGIPIFGYNFSIAGVAGRIKGPFARGQAEAVGVDGAFDKPMPQGMAWNMIYDSNAPAGIVTSATQEELWQRLSDFLNAIIPVAEEAGVTLAAHPDDPPLATVRAQPRLVYQPRLYQKLLDLKPSPRNALEFCVGSLAEMTEGGYLRNRRNLRPAAQNRLRSPAQCAGQSSALPGNVHRRRGCRNSPRVANSEANRLPRGHHSRSRPANDVRRAVALRHGVRAGIYSLCAANAG